VNDASTENQTAAINPEGEKPSLPLAEPSAASLEAGEQALETQLLESAPKRGRGRPITHGLYAKKGKVPLGKMGNGTNPLLLDAGQPEGLQSAALAAVPEKPFNEAVNREYSKLLIKLLQCGNNAFKRRKIIKATDNAELADWVIERKTISDPARESLENGMVECARKYGWDLSQTPEGLIIGGFLLWQAEDAASTDRLIADYKKLRPEAKP